MTGAAPWAEIMNIPETPPQPGTHGIGTALMGSEDPNRGDEL